MSTVHSVSGKHQRNRLHSRPGSHRQQPVWQLRHPDRPPLWAACAVGGGFCVLFFVLVFGSARQTSATYDETAHLPAGYSYLLWNDYRMNPEHPPLIKKLAAIPLLQLRLWPSEMDFEGGDAMKGAQPATALAAKQAWAMGLSNIDAQWLFGHHLLYGLRDEALKRFGVDDPLKVPTTALLTRNDFLLDADRLLLWGRIPIMLLGVLLAVLVFSWALELYGMAGGILAIALFCFDPNFIGHSGLVTTDVGVALFMFGAVYFLWRSCRRLTPINAVLTVACVALAFAAKFSAFLLVPVFFLAGTARTLSKEGWPAGIGGRWILDSRHSRAAAFGGLSVASLAAALCLLWALYGFRYSAAANPAQAAANEVVALSSTNQPAALQPWQAPGYLPIENLVRKAAATAALLDRWPQGVPAAAVRQAMPGAPLSITEKLILLARDARLLPEAYLYGLAQARLKSLTRGSFLFGEYSNRGFDTYFLWTFLLKTPLVTIACIFAAFCFAVRRREHRSMHLAFLVVPAGLYLVVSIASGLNIGHRHLLPVYPFLFVCSGGLALEWAKWRPRRRWVAALVAAAAILIGSFVVFAPPWKPAVVYPHNIAYFNELAGGPRNGHKSLVDSNLDWGQDLKRLKQWLSARGIVQPIALCYFGTASPLFYQIPHVNMPGGYAFEREVSFISAAIPGYVAISATSMAGVYMDPPSREAWRAFLRRATLVDTVGYSIFVYYLDRPPS